MTQSNDTTGINALCASLTPDLSTENGQITTTSLQVAQHFGKSHKNVLRDIRNLECSPEFRRLNFEPVIVEYTNGKGGVQKAPACRMTRDGFVFLAMGFTGEEAAQWKESYIVTFNKMETALLEHRQAAALQVQTQLRAELAQTHQRLKEHKDEIDFMRLDYSGLQDDLIKSQGHQIRLMRQIQNMNHAREARQAKLNIIQMTRDGYSNTQIVAATGRNLNHVRQVQWQARKNGTLPPLPEVVSPQTTLFTEAA